MFSSSTIPHNFKSSCSHWMLVTVKHWPSFRLYQFNENKVEYLSYAPSGKTSHSDTAGSHFCSVALTRLQYTPLFMSISVSYIKVYSSWDHDLYQQNPPTFCDLEWRMFSGLVVCFGRIVFTYPWRLSRSFHNFLTNFKQPFFSLLFSFYCSEFLEKASKRKYLNL